MKYALACSLTLFSLSFLFLNAADGDDTGNGHWNANGGGSVRNHWNQGNDSSNGQKVSKWARPDSSVQSDRGNTPQNYRDDSTAQVYTSGGSYGNVGFGNYGNAPIPEEEEAPAYRGKAAKTVYENKPAVEYPPVNYAVPRSYVLESPPPQNNYVNDGYYPYYPHNNWNRSRAYYGLNYPTYYDYNWFGHGEPDYSGYWRSYPSTLSTWKYPSYPYDGTYYKSSTPYHHLNGY